MTTATLDRTVATASGAPKRGVLGRLVDRVGGGLVQALLVVIAVFWLVPTLGLFIVSIREEEANNASGWWTFFTEPAQLTLENYSNLLASGFTSSFWNTVLITVPSTILVIVIAAMAAYAFAWIEFPGRDMLFLIVVALLVAPIQIALIPIAKLYGSLGIFGSILGVVLFHVAFGLPFAIFLLRNFF